ncbi:MAG: M20/M25/M40 family metallo-hydrolase, partial [Bdellovibrionota bacterium]
MTILSVLLALFSSHAFAASPTGIIAELELLDKVGAVTFAREESIGLGYALVTQEQQDQISAAMHARGKCAGFESVALPTNNLLASAQRELHALSMHVSADQKRTQLPNFAFVTGPDPRLVAAIGELQAENIHSTVSWLSAFPNRYNRDATPNVAIDAMAERIRGVLANSPVSWKLDLISHRSTTQKSIRVHIEGKTRPSEIIVLGGHIDSINQASGTIAPGADDNASGSASILEALRVFVNKGQPERSVEFMWYAGEESGLLGSAEIAKQYKQENKDVVAVLQLDMTMFPGGGKSVVMNTTDYTSTWLQNYFKAMNEAYLKVQIVDDQCGYACSDHASWYRQGYPSVFPFEAPFES